MARGMMDTKNQLWPSSPQSSFPVPATNEQRGGEMETTTDKSIDHEAVGTVVTYYDEYGRPAPALVTRIWGEKLGECSINLVHVSLDASRKDQYGRQTEHVTSVVQKAAQSAHGRYYEV
jgi:hypothetical protein